MLPPLDVVALTQALVRVPSPSGGEGALAEVVRRVMEERGFEVEVDAWGNTLGIRRGAVDGPVLVFDAHMDVVGPGTEPWPRDPYSAAVEHGRLHGRGAADTKGSLAAMLCAAAEAPVERFAGTVIVAATVCEENLTGAALGRVLDRWPATLVVTGEPTGLGLGVAQKGRATLAVKACGRSAHTSRPELGDNAVYKMIEAVRRLRELTQPSHPALGPALLELVELVSEPLPNHALVPDGCSASFIARTLPGQTRDSLLAEWRGALVDLPGISLHIETLRQKCYTGEILEAEDFLPPWETPVDDPWRRRLLAALARSGLNRGAFAAPCGTNASESAGRRGLPSFILGPGTLAEAHIVDEWVETAELQLAVRAYAAILSACLARSDAS